MPTDPSEINIATRRSEARREFLTLFRSVVQFYCEKTGDIAEGADRTNLNEYNTVSSASDGQPGFEKNVGTSLWREIALVGGGGIVSKLLPQAGLVVTAQQDENCLG
jgi:hypothetical protein